MTNENTTVSFEMIDKTALEFAIALIASGNVNNQQQISEQAMELSKDWYADASLRKSWFISSNLQESDWIKIDADKSYQPHDFNIGDEYWVFCKDEDPIKAKVNCLHNVNGRMQPYFSRLDDDGHYFSIVAFLPKALGDQIFNCLSLDNPNPKNYSYSNENINDF